jgi:hypothetical protein
MSKLPLHPAVPISMAVHGQDGGEYSPSSGDGVG